MMGDDRIVPVEGGWAKKLAPPSPGDYDTSHIYHRPCRRFGARRPERTECQGKACTSRRYSRGSASRCALICGVDGRKEQYKALLERHFRKGASSSTRPRCWLYEYASSRQACLCRASRQSVYSEFDVEKFCSLRDGQGGPREGGHRGGALALREGLLVPSSAIRQPRAARR